MVCAPSFCKHCCVFVGRSIFWFARLLPSPHMLFHQSSRPSPGGRGYVRRGGRHGALDAPAEQTRAGDAGALRRRSGEREKERGVFGRGNSWCSRVLLIRVDRTVGPRIAAKPRKPWQVGGAVVLGGFLCRRKNEHSMMYESRRLFSESREEGSLRDESFFCRGDRMYGMVGWCLEGLVL